MMAHAAQLERSGFVTRVQPVSNVLSSQGSQHDIHGDFATLPLMKGQMGFVHGKV